MKFTCYKNDLVEAMQILIRSVAVKPITPILAGMYLNACDNYLEIQANNFTSAVSVKIPLNLESGGEVVLNGRQLYNFIRNMPEDTINFFGEEADTTFSLESGGAKAEFMTMNVLDFPKVKVPETDKSFRIRAVALKSLIRKTAFAAAKDNDRPVFKSCYFNVTGEKVLVCATNAHRIAIDSDVVRDNYDDGELLIPADVLRGFMHYIDPNDVENYVEVKYSRRQVSFKFNNVYITVRQNEGEFPPYNQLINKNFTTTVEVNKAEFRNAVEFVSLMAKDDNENHMMLFNISPDQIGILSNSTEYGNAQKAIEAQMDGDPLTIAFNVNYFLDALRVMESQRLLLRFTSSSEPIYIKEADNEHFSYLVTPVRF